MNLSEDVVEDCCWLSEELDDPPVDINELVRRNLCFGECGLRDNTNDDFDLGFEIGALSFGLGMSLESRGVSNPPLFISPTCVGGI